MEKNILIEEQDEVLRLIDQKELDEIEASAEEFDGFTGIRIVGRVQPEVMQLLADITENKLLVRPSLVGGWWVSKWKGVTGLNEAYCDGIIGEGKTILDAVNEWKKLSKQSA